MEQNDEYHKIREKFRLLRNWRSPVTVKQQRRLPARLFASIAAIDSFAGHID